MHGRILGLTIGRTNNKYESYRSLKTEAPSQSRLRVFAEDSTQGTSSKSIMRANEKELPKVVFSFSC